VWCVLYTTVLYFGAISKCKFKTEFEVNLTIGLRLDFWIGLRFGLKRKWKLKRHIADCAGYQLMDNGSLRISSVSMKDSGIYVCVAQNSAGTAMAQVRLQVQGQGHVTTRHCSRSLAVRLLQVVCDKLALDVVFACGYFWTPCSKKINHQMQGGNLVKSKPTLKFLSPADRDVPVNL